MSEFEKLLAELNATADQSSTLAKALPADDGEDDKAIQAAAADGADADDNPEDAEGSEGGGDEGKEPMAKSMTIDGEEVQVLDGEEFLKSLSDLGGRLTTHEQMLVKALEATNGALKQQNELIKSLTDQVNSLSNQGRGRKTVLAVHEKKDPVTTLAKSEPQGMTGGEIMAKALSLQSAGKLTGLEVSRVENHLNAGLGVPADVLAKLN